MRAVKVFNNNAVSVVTPEGEEAILLGNGIGFNKRPGQEVDEKRIEKVFHVRSDLQSKFLELMKDTRESALDAASLILDHAKEMGLDTGKSLILSLTDHINFAIDRAEQGIALPYLMLSETKMLYPKEYELGKWAIGCIEEQCGVRLPDYEAGYIALQLASCTSDKDTVYQTLQLVQGALHIVSDEYGCDLADDNLDVMRLTTHLKFLAQRVFSNSIWHEEKPGALFRMLKREYPGSYACSLRISHFIDKNFNYELNDQELTYLMVHLSKIYGY